MLMALLRGKLSREQENMEDILTSNVFGLLKYLPPLKGVVPFLAAAQYFESKENALVFKNPFTWESTDVKSVEYKFWPSYSAIDCKTCIPDVEILVTWGSGKRVLVFVEAKYHAGKSPEEDFESKEAHSAESPVDQLAKEWHYLISAARNVKAEPFLVYLTPDLGTSCKDIADSSNAYTRSCPQSTEVFRCAWLSWRHLHAHCHRAPNDEVLSDIKNLLTKLNLASFEGIDSFHPIKPFDWTYDGRFNEGFEEPTVLTEFDFSSFPRIALDWRFRDE